mmetsp:Transcript_137138/g.438535  ORF Transcript_137138/g.438535 Transcript_137138/m.438535 type:complete len:228 (-) Transcript_137138:1011-1694(-)
MRFVSELLSKSHLCESRAAPGLRYQVVGAVAGRLHRAPYHRRRTGDRDGQQRLQKLRAPGHQRVLLLVHIRPREATLRRRGRPGRRHGGQLGHQEAAVIRRRWAGYDKPRLVRKANRVFSRAVVAYLDPLGLLLRRPLFRRLEQSGSNDGNDKPCEEDLLNILRKLSQDREEGVCKADEVVEQEEDAQGQHLNLREIVRPLHHGGEEVHGVAAQQLWGLLRITRHPL